jgi:hypothetical protein
MGATQRNKTRVPNTRASTVNEGVTIGEINVVKSRQFLHSPSRANIFHLDSKISFSAFDGIQLLVKRTRLELRGTAEGACGGKFRFLPVWVGCTAANDNRFSYG